jgi:3-dehydroquinate synthetase
MCVSAEISYGRGYCDARCLEEHYRHVLDLGLPAHIPESMTPDMVLAKIVYDKHYVHVPSMGLCAAVGEMACDRENGNTFAFGVQSVELVAALQANMQRRGKCGDEHMGC